MEKPVALKLTNSVVPDVYGVSIDPMLAERFQNEGSASDPAVVVTRKASILQDVSAGVVDEADVVAVLDGNWNSAILVVLNADGAFARQRKETEFTGDSKFLKRVQRIAPELADLARHTLEVIRESGVDGELVEGKGGKWVNRPLNTFTLKAQPRKRNLAFTLYGNPDSYDAGEFLLKDQNSYSRGWVRDAGDARKLAELARQSHARRK